VSLEAQAHIEAKLVLLAALQNTHRRLWWFIECDHGDGNEIDAADVAAEAIEIQREIDRAIEVALSAPDKGQA
jgi:phage-related tail protein